MSDQSDEPFLQIVVCAAGVAADVGKLITAAQEQHWDVGVVATGESLNGAPVSPPATVATPTHFNEPSGQ